MAAAAHSVVGSFELVVVADRVAVHAGDVKANALFHRTEVEVFRMGELGS
jgi:hypothetical protein